MQFLKGLFSLKSKLYKLVQKYNTTLSKRVYGKTRYHNGCRVWRG